MWANNKELKFIYVKKQRKFTQRWISLWSGQRWWCHRHHHHPHLHPPEWLWLTKLVLRSFSFSYASIQVLPVGARREGLTQVHRIGGKYPRWTKVSDVCWTSRPKFVARCSRCNQNRTTSCNLAFCEADEQEQCTPAIYTENVLTGHVYVCCTNTRWHNTRTLTRTRVDVQ